MYMIVTSSTKLEDIQKKFPDIIYNIKTVTGIEDFLKRVREIKQIFIIYNDNGKLIAERDTNILGEL